MLHITLKAKLYRIKLVALPYTYSLYNELPRISESISGHCSTDESGSMRLKIERAVANTGVHFNFFRWIRF